MIPLRERTFLKTSLETTAPPFEPWFRLDWEPNKDLCFTVGCCKNPANSIAKSRLNSFLEQLWKHDVGELFIKHAENDSYLEINLAPYGGWWACLFNGYREAASDPALAPFEPTQLDTETSESAWKTSLTLPLPFLEERLAFGPESLGNVCFILGPPNERHHFSLAPLSHDPPDYHRVADFVGME